MATPPITVRPPSIASSPGRPKKPARDCLVHCDKHWTGLRHKPKPCATDNCRIIELK
jgi:hypothetical protein